MCSNFGLWINSFLLDRPQHVLVNGRKSECGFKFVFLFIQMRQCNMDSYKIRRGHDIGGMCEGFSIIG